MTDKNSKLYSLIFESNETGMRLDSFLAENSAKLLNLEITRSQIKRLVKIACIRVNGQIITKASFLLKMGMQIELELPETSQKIEPYDFPLNIIFKDNYLLVINKPAGISMHPGAGNTKQTILNAILPYLSEQPETFPSGTRPGIVHRLDKDTTGLVVIARTAAVQNKLTEQFAKRTIERNYQVLVATTPRARRLIQRGDSGKIETNIARDAHDRKKQAVVTTGGRKAVTYWSVIERFTHAALLDIKLATGRTHQIRVHMQHIGSPVVGDLIYGDLTFLPNDLKRAAIQFGRQALHAYKLGFVHPITGEKLSFSVGLPEDMQELVKMFGGRG